MVKWTYFSKGKANVVFINPGTRFLLRVPVHKPARDVYSGSKAVEAVIGSQYCAEIHLVKYKLEDLPAEFQSIVYDKKEAIAVRFVGELALAPGDLSSVEIFSSSECTVYKYPRSVVIEFKPKWLLQSPNAPVNANWCRTCALSLKRHHCKPSFCRLDLATSEAAILQNALNKMLASVQAITSLDTVSMSQVCAQVFCQSKVLLALEKAQAADKRGILAYKGQDYIPQELVYAMSLRDCTLLTQIYDPGCVPDNGCSEFSNSEHEAANAELGPSWYIIGDRYVQTKLVDLDFKPHKRSHWEQVETELQKYYCYDLDGQGCPQLMEHMSR